MVSNPPAFFDSKLYNRKNIFKIRPLLIFLCLNWAVFVGQLYLNSYNTKLDIFWRSQKLFASNSFLMLHSGWSIWGTIISNSICRQIWDIIVPWMISLWASNELCKDRDRSLAFLPKFVKLQTLHDGPSDLQDNLSTRINDLGRKVHGLPPDRSRIARHRNDLG